MLSETYKNIPRINIFFAGDKKGVDILNRFVKLPDSHQNLTIRRNLHIVKKEAEADYVIRSYSKKFLFITQQRWYSITYPFSQEAICASVLYKSRDNIALRYILFEIFFYISEWEGVRRLKNSHDNHTINDKCSINIYKALDETNGDKDILLHKENNIVEIDNLNHIRVSVTNHSDEKLYLALFYLDDCFGVMKLSDDNIQLPPNEVFWMQEGEAIEYELPTHILAFNHQKAFFEFKLVYSLEPLNDFYTSDCETFYYPHPKLIDEYDFYRTAMRRKVPEASIWATDSVRVLVKNPHYKPE